VWKNPNGKTNRVQTLAWDARGRLYKVTDRIVQYSNTVAVATNGVDLAATYDALGRLLRARETPVSNSVVLSSQVVVIDHYYDPQVEFLELAVSENGRTTWKLIGPDTDGVYGGQNGTGGFDALVPGPELFCPMISDAFGNLHAVYDQTHSNLTWYASRLTGYGAVPGYRPVPLGQVSADLGAKCAWHNRAMTSVGLMWLGGNWYDPASGQFLSFDPAGHNGSDSGYSFCQGNPYGSWDADGRYAKRLANNLPAPGTSLTANDLQRASGFLSYLSDHAENGAASGVLDFASSGVQIARGMLTPGGQLEGAEHLANNSALVYNNARSGGDGYISASYQAAGYAAGSVVGATPLYEGVNGIDLATGQELSGVDRTSRVLTGGGQLILTGVATAGMVEGRFGPAPPAEETIPATIYREGNPNPSNLTPRPSDNGLLSFRDSLSNPWPLEAGQRPVLRPGQPYIEVNTGKLPPGSVIPDNVPPGHVGVNNVPVQVIQDAVSGRGRFPK